MSEVTKPDPYDLEAGAAKMDGSLRPAPKFADRISKKVIGVVMLFFVTLVVIFLTSLNGFDNKKPPPVPVKQVQKAMTDKDKDKDAFNGVPKEDLGVTTTNNFEKKPLPASVIKTGEVVPPVVVDASKPVGGKVASGQSTGVIPNMGHFGIAPAGSLESAPIGGAGNAPNPYGAGYTVPAISPQMSPEKIAEAEAKKERQVRMTQARTSGLVGKSFESDSATETRSTGSSAAGQSGSGNLELIKEIAKANTPAAQQKELGEQDEKLDFVKSASKEALSYHPHVALAAISKNEVKQGSFIPMTLETGINSDLPGQITARVSESIYDSITGCRLLIPPMTKAVGKYDSKVVLGQSRMLVIWNALVFPNGDELNLAGMQGYTPDGAAGLDSDVDNHYLRLFGLALGMSMVTTGVQLSIPQPNQGAGGAAASQTPSQILSASLGQQYGQLGAQIINKYMSVQPTLRDAPGEKFMIMVPHTIVFPKVWAMRCNS